MSSCAYWWNAAAVFLLFVWALQRPWPGARGLCFSILSAAVLSLVPFFGHELRYWLSGLTPNVSASLVALLLVGIFERAGIASVFRPREWRAAWIFGSVSALLLYPSALGLGLRNFDSYSLGWLWLDRQSSLLLFSFAALSASVLLWRGNRFGWVLVLASTSFLLRIQESQNFWDYLVDPVYAMASLLVCLRLVLPEKWRG